MPPRKRRQRANGDPDASGDDGAGPGPSSQVAGLLDVLDAVLAHGRHERGCRRALRVLCRRARDAVDSAIGTLDLDIGMVRRKLLLHEHRAALLRFFPRLRGLRELKATLDAAMLVQLAASRSGMSAPAGPAPSSSLPSVSRRSSMGLRRMELHLPADCTLGPWDLGAVLSAFPGVEVSPPLCVHACARPLGASPAPSVPLDSFFLTHPLVEPLGAGACPPAWPAVPQGRSSRGPSTDKAPLPPCNLAHPHNCGWHAPQSSRPTEDPKPRHPPKPT
jgi:hypothetical protein